MVPNLKNLKKVYGTDAAVFAKQLQRYQALDQKFCKKFAEIDRHYFSAPGRTEICGNHTDHNHGLVLTASINLDAIAVAAAAEIPTITVYSEQYKQPFQVQLAELKRVEKERGTTTALIRGIAARFQQLGFQIGGFNAYLGSDVLPGSGLSSSAAIEVLLGTILNSFYNRDRIPPEMIARIGQFSENEYFGKPCGLMDQMAAAVGGIIAIDFKNPQRPAIRKIDYDFGQTHYRILVIDTGGNHINLTPDYAAVPDEMKQVARQFGVDVLRDIDQNTFLHRIPDLREKISDRAVLRALHFYAENERVDRCVQVLEEGNFNEFLKLLNESGNSSFKWLQNTYSIRNVDDQGVPLALALTEKFISKHGSGAGRIHGGGFAGTILVIIPEQHVEEYVKLMKANFGDNCSTVLSIRSVGACGF